MNQGSDQKDPAKEQDLPSIDDFGERLSKVRDQNTPVENAEKSTSTLGWGLRIGSEMIAALLVGGALGWGLDGLIGTKPWFLLAGFFVGFAAGLVNVQRAIKEMDAGLEQDGEKE